MHIESAHETPDSRLSVVIGIPVFNGADNPEAALLSAMSWTPTVLSQKAGFLRTANVSVRCERRGNQPWVSAAVNRRGRRGHAESEQSRA